jgi:hypothetical protein
MGGKVGKNVGIEVCKNVGIALGELIRLDSDCDLTR